MAFKYCQHVRENGTFCRSGAVKGRDYCYFHLRSRAQRLAAAQASSQQQPWHPDLPPLEDMRAVQVALMRVLDGLATDSIEPRRAALMLKGLQQAASNMRSVTGWLRPDRFEPSSSEDDRTVESYPGLEFEFGLPRRIDLDAPSQMIFPAPIKIESPTLAIDSKARENASAPRKPSKSVKPEKAWHSELLKKAE
jgi:hypothetical protein